MTIQVVSNDVPAEKPADAPVEQSAPEAQATEQNASPESETEETEAKEESEESEESIEETEESKEAKDKPKKKGGFQRRIDKLNARYAAAQSEIEHWKSMALKGAGESKPEKVETPKPAAADGKPNPDNFETHAEYVEALTDWKTEQKLKERDQKAEQTRLQTEQEKALSAHIERVKSFAEKTEDFNEVLSEVDHIPVSAAVQEIILSSENGPELMYELAKNAKEYERICKLPPLAAAREIGKIEIKISAKASEEKKPEPKKLTKAPKPIDPVGTAKGTVTKSLDDPSLTQAEYEAIRREQMRKASA